jgi:hypothetical protein
MPRRCELQEQLAVVEAEEPARTPSEQISKSLRAALRFWRLALLRWCKVV